MHVLYVHQYFTTRSGFAGTRSYEFARALIEHGHQVTMLCGSAGRAVSGLDTPFIKGRRCGTVDGIEVVEFAIAYANQDSIFSRARKFLFFSWVSAIEALTRDYDLVFASSTPLTAAVPGILARVFRRKPFVFEVRDLWPELPKAMGMKNPVALAAMHVLEWLGYKTANRVIALAPGIADGIARCGISRSRIDLVPNGCDMELFASVTPLRPHDAFPGSIAKGDLVAIFAGAHGRANGLDTIIDVAKVLRGRSRDDVKLLLIGDGALKQKLITDAAVYGLENLVFSDSMPKLDLARLLKGADLGLQILANVPAFYNGTSPNKFFDYLAASRPVLINYPGWLADLVVAEKCGFAIRPSDPEAFADTLIWLSDHRDDIPVMGARAHTLGWRNFNREMLASQFVTALETAKNRSTMSA